MAEGGRGVDFWSVPAALSPRRTGHATGRPRADGSCGPRPKVAACAQASTLGEVRSPLLRSLSLALALGLLPTPGRAADPGSTPAPAANLRAQGALTLAAAIDEALRHAPRLHQAAAVQAEAAHHTRRVRASFLPQLQLYANHLFVARFYQMELGKTAGADLVALRAPSTEIGAQADLSLFDGMQNVLRLQASRRAHEAADQEHAWARFSLARQVRFAFHQVLAGQLVEQAARRNVETLVGHKAQIDSLRSQGAATDFDVLRVQVQLENAGVQMAEAEDRTALARRRLAQTMGLRDDDRALSGELPRPDAAVTQRVAALDELPQFLRLDMRAMRSREEAHRKLREAARSFWIPKVDVHANFTHYDMWDKEITRGHLFRAFRMVGVRVRWNIFDGLASLAEAGEEEARRLQVRHARHQAELEQSYALVEGKRDYLLALKQLRARELNVHRAEENVRLARSGLANGTQDSTDVLDAEQDLFASRAGAIEALLRVEEASVHLDLALGSAL